VTSSTPTSSDSNNLPDGVTTTTISLASTGVASPSVTDMNPTRVTDPNVGISARRTVTLKIATLDAETNCDFWVGVASSGKISPLLLLEEPSVQTIFSRAAAEGVTESEPIMLSDTERASPRFVYLLPMPGAEFRDQVLWVDDLVATIRAWSPRRVGFYLAPELLDTGTGQSLLLMAMKELIGSTDVNEFYLLVGSHGLNTVLNGALQLKEEIDEDQSLNFMVFH